MTDQFFVDADGLDGGRDGFDGKSAELRTLAQRVQSLANPSRIRDAAGNDKNGNQFSATNIQSAAEIYNGINAWALAVEATRDAIGDMATSFREADQGAYDGANSLFKNFTDLHDKVRKADPGGSSDAPPTEYQRGVRIQGKLLRKEPEAEDGGGWAPAKQVRARIADRVPAEPGERVRHLTVGHPAATPLQPTESRVFVRSEKPVHAVEDKEETPEGEVTARTRPREVWLAKSVPAEPPIPPAES
ncbi:hypothetical protein [Amycolatopsis echigonensis]|uniref:Uncharacterized protein n=1 Tax=Amycolatopsis echigonensis TaxID=2576905 RepID=A0A2N3WVR1_9PSEU|nr:MULTISPECIES: hypothetical protein [Amycolatopsis]MBB2504639.1 hypothetical protein [Amycolatopsis echigonensis]PKV97955.1 hypothetical protein ATK30_8958 [Amycolatopsis niigatensis]